MRKFFNFKVSGKDIISHPLFSGSMVMIVGSNIANLMAYFYHVIMGRMLGPGSYGELSAVISIIAIILSIFNFLGIVIVKFVSSSDKDELKSLFAWLTNKALIASSLLAILLLILTPFLSRFLHTEIKILVLIIPITVFGIYSFVYRAFLQGLLKFKEFVYSLNSDFFTRLFLGLILVYLGLSTFGAVVAITMAFFVSFLFSRKYLGDFAARSVKKFSKQNELFKYSAPVLVSSLAVNSMLSVDVILVKHFLESHQAGIYASLATLGKIIFYGASPVSWVMFPMVSKSEQKGGNYKKIFVMSLFLTLAIAMGVNLIYLLFPEISIKMLYGVKYLEGKVYLFLFGIYMAIFTLSSLFLNYFLSRNKTKVVYFALIASVIQIVGIWYYHENIRSVISVSILASAIFLILIFGYFLADRKK